MRVGKLSGRRQSSPPQAAYNEDEEKTGAADTEDALPISATVSTSPPHRRILVEVDSERKGWWGKGPPNRARTSAASERPVVDGGGFCSPGRWAPENRRLPQQASVLTKALEETALEKDGILGVNAITLKSMMGMIDFGQENPPPHPGCRLQDPLRGNPCAGLLPGGP